MDESRICVICGEDPDKIDYIKYARQMGMGKSDLSNLENLR